MHKSVERQLLALGWSVEREFEVPDRGDGKSGRIDLVVTAPHRIAIELDYLEPRVKSLMKLKTFDGDRAVVLRRNGNDRMIDGTLVLCLAAPQPLRPPQRDLRTTRTDVAPDLNRLWDRSTMNSGNDGLDRQTRAVLRRTELADSYRALGLDLEDCLARTEDHWRAEGWLDYLRGGTPPTARQPKLEPEPAK